MSRLVVLDEFHVTIKIHARLPDKDVQEVRRVLRSRAFRQQLWQALLTLQATAPALSPVRFVVSR
ncbi:MAG: hypothetical protein K1X57_07130 [Gemmataceae bacterium]|nr:hypothetical protein [Gemmataceae bacterium]